MDIRVLTETMAVGPQIARGDVAALKEAGYAVLINNRPDEEVALTGEPSSDEIRAEAEAAGLAYHYIPVPGSGFGPEHVVAVRDAVAGQSGPVFAYCRSGTRSCNVWALAMSGDLASEAILEAGAKGGYDLRGLSSMLGSRIG